MEKDDFQILNNKLDGLKEDFSTMNVTLSVQSEVLKEHTRRSDLLEEDVKMLRQDVKPLQTHVAMVNGAFKFLGLVTAVGGIIVGILKILKG